MGEYSGSAILRRYVPGPNIDEPLVWYEGAGVSGRRWLHADREGSIIAWSDAGGNLGAAFGYSPYGEPSSWTGSRFAYTGQIAIPEAELYHYKSRVYDPGFGRFLQTDAVGYTSDVNLYQYVENDPVNQSDPTREDGTDVTEVVVAGRRIPPFIVIGIPTITLFPTLSNLLPRLLFANKQNISSPSYLGCVASSTVAGGGAGAVVGGLFGGGVGGMVGGAGGTLVAPGLGTVAGGVLGVEGGSSVGAGGGAAVGSVVGTFAGSILCSQGAGPTSGGNVRENAQAADARKQAERVTGKKFNRDLQRQFHDRITGQNYDYHDLIAEAIEVLNGR